MFELWVVTPRANCSVSAFLCSMSEWSEVRLYIPSAPRFAFILRRLPCMYYWDAVDGPNQSKIMSPLVNFAIMDRRPGDVTRTLRHNYLLKWIYLFPSPVIDCIDYERLQFVVINKSKSFILDKKVHRQHF